MWGTKHGAIFVPHAPKMALGYRSCLIYHQITESPETSHETHNRLAFYWLGEGGFGRVF